MSWAIAGLVGALAGVLSALLGVGGGVILVPAMQMMGLPFKVAVGTSLAVIIPTALMGVVRHYQFGNVDLKVAGLLAISAVIGSNVGAYIVRYIPEVPLKRLFALFLLYTAFKLFFNK